MQLRLFLDGDDLRVGLSVASPGDDLSQSLPSSPNRNTSVFFYDDNMVASANAEGET